MKNSIVTEIINRIYNVYGSTSEIQAILKKHGYKVGQGYVITDTNRKRLIKEPSKPRPKRISFLGKVPAKRQGKEA